MAALPWAIRENSCDSWLNTRHDLPSRGTGVVQTPEDSLAAVTGFSSAEILAAFSRRGGG